MSKATTSKEETDLGDQMLQLNNHTIDEDRVYGKVMDVDDGGDSIGLTIKVLTTGDEITVSFEKPKTWSRTYNWVRFVEWCGYNAASSLQVVGEEVPLRDVEDGWELDTERVPGEALFEESDYYSGAIRGAALSAVYLISLPVISTVGGYTDISVAVQGGLLSGVGLVVIAVVWLYICAKVVHRSPDDDKETLRWSEVSASDVQGEEP